MVCHVPKEGVACGWQLWNNIRVYFVLSPAGAGLTYYWCAIKIFVLFFAISAGRRKSQKTKPGSAPTGLASAIVVRVDYFRVLWLARANYLLIFLIHFIFLAHVVRECTKKK